MRLSSALLYRWMLATSATVLISGAPLLAADKLPKDGAWARYYVHGKYSNGRELIWRMTVRLVGTVVEDGRKLRWLEVSQTFEPERPGNTGEKKVTSVHKLLIPERALLESGSPLKQFVRGWLWDNVIKRADKLDTRQRDRLYYAAMLRPFVMFFPGPLKQTRPTRHARDVDYQNGRLHVAGGLAGQHVARWHAFTVPEQRWITDDVELWLHKDVPLRMASATLKRTYRFKEDGKNKPEKVRISGDEDYTVEAWGTGATSALPKAQ
jgi:hypothetical protein